MGVFWQKSTILVFYVRAAWCDGTRLIGARRKRELGNLVQIGRLFS